jgi:heme-degrading monooxygenase HmoA
MKASFLIFGCVLGCGPMPTNDDLPAIDETQCSRERLEADGRDSQALEQLPPGEYVFATTYLRLPLRRSALARFNELNGPMGEALAGNPGSLRVVTRLSEKCNTARTLTVWRDEAAMMAFVTSTAHGQAMGSVREVSRGGSITAQWRGPASEFAWAKATENLAVSTKTVY